MRNLRPSKQVAAQLAELLGNFPYLTKLVDEQELKKILTKNRFGVENLRLEERLLFDSIGRFDHDMSAIFYSDPFDRTKTNVMQLPRDKKVWQAWPRSAIEFECAAVIEVRRNSVAFPNDHVFIHTVSKHGTEYKRFWWLLKEILQIAESPRSS